MTENEIIASAYTAAADVFETYASDQDASKRFFGKRARTFCEIRAATWRDAAAELRKAALNEPPA